MPSQTFSIKNNRFNRKHGSLLISQEELIEQFFHGIKLCVADGKELTLNAIKQKIIAAQDRLEAVYSIKLWPQYVEESSHFIIDRFNFWGFIKTTWPVREVCELKGKLGDNLQIISYPIQWASISYSSDERYFFRQLSLVPAGTSTAGVQFNNLVQVGISPFPGILGTREIPNYWIFKYKTGFDKLPYDLLESLGKLASIPLFAILGDILLGAGIASQSISYDGLSESINTTQSAENSAFSARIKQYNSELKEAHKEMWDFYVGISFEIL